MRKLVIEDDFDWALPDENGEDEGKEEVLRYVGGVDVSFSKEDSAIACACIVVLDVEAVEVVYEDYCVTRLEVPYVVGFLTFREVCLVGYRADGVPMKFVVRESGDSVKDFRVVGWLKEDENRLQSILPAAVDGGWKWIASSSRQALVWLATLGCWLIFRQLGSLHHTEGLTRINVGELLQHDSCSELVDLIRSSGHTLGVAMRSTLSTLKPIFTSRWSPHLTSHRR
ncbi:hypothetical protein Droror1_Dr00004291 [Drosera rotundifolia]